MKIYIILLFFFLLFCSVNHEISIENFPKKIIQEGILQVEAEYDENFEINHDVNFYSQFPLTWAGKYNEPYQNFCEESSLLNAFYYFKWITSSKEDYIKDLNKLKEIEDKLFWENWYKDTSLRQSLLLFLFFQNEGYLEEFLKNSNINKKKEILQKLIAENTKKLWVIWKIESFSNYSINKEKVKQDIYFKILSSIKNWDLVIIPVYWKWLKNPFFSYGWPVYHNLIITWIKWKNIDEWFFITQEVWITKGANFKYDKKIILENIYDFDKSLYPNNFTNWKQKILILSKNK